MPLTKLVALLFLAASASGQTYVCGPVTKGAAFALTAGSVYSQNAAGFDLGSAPRIDRAGCTSDRAFFFSVPVVEGNYRVSVTLGGAAASVTTVRAEARRLMLDRVKTRAGGERGESFIVNVRRPEIARSDASVKRKPREMNSLNWDTKLTLEFAGVKPSIRSIRLERADNVPTVYLAGDSTVVDQDNEPWAAWGQMLPAFFGPSVAIANEAESGETIRSFVTERRFDKIFSTIRAGDYLFMQFAHNDQKPGTGYVPPDMYEGLLRKYIAMARDRRATPVLVTSMNRRTFDASGHVTDTLAPYPDIMRKVAAAEQVALIDLNAMSRQLYEAIGEAHSRSLFVYAAPNTYPNQPEALHDDTHFNGYGAYELARCVVLGIQELKLPLASALRAPHGRFDPTHPDAPAAVALPVTPFFDLEKPYER